MALVFIMRTRIYQHKNRTTFSAANSGYSDAANDLTGENGIFWGPGKMKCV